MQVATLCFPIRDDSVLLIEKRRGLGSGWVNAPGGTVEPGETPRECAIREVREEVVVTVSDVEKVGELTFVLDDSIHTVCHVFRSTDVAGEPRRTQEAIPVWFPVDSVPYDRMWPDDHHWVPRVLAGDTVSGSITFTGGEPLDEATLVDHDFEWGVSFDAEP